MNSVKTKIILTLFILLFIVSITANAILAIKLNGTRSEMADADNHLRNALTSNYDEIRFVIKEELSFFQLYSESEDKILDSYSSTGAFLASLYDDHLCYLDHLLKQMYTLACVSYTDGSLYILTGGFFGSALTVLDYLREVSDDTALAYPEYSEITDLLDITVQFLSMLSEDFEETEEESSDIAEKYYIFFTKLVSEKQTMHDLLPY